MLHMAISAVHRGRNTRPCRTIMSGYLRSVPIPCTAYFRSYEPEAAAPATAAATRSILDGLSENDAIPNPRATETAHFFESPSPSADCKHHFSGVLSRIAAVSVHSIRMYNHQFPAYRIKSWLLVGAVKHQYVVCSPSGINVAHGFSRDTQMLSIYA